MFNRMLKNSPHRVARTTKRLDCVKWALKYYKYPYSPFSLPAALWHALRSVRLFQHPVNAKNIPLCLWIIILTACAVHTNKETLTEAIHRYNSAIRWGDPGMFVQYIPPPKRDELINKRLSTDQLQIASFEVNAIRFRTKQEAVAWVRVEWYLVPQGRLHFSLVAQTWRRIKGKWFIIGQRTIRGSSYPLLSMVAPIDLRLSIS